MQITDEISKNRAKIEQMYQLILIAHNERLNLKEQIKALQEELQFLKEAAAHADNIITKRKNESQSL